MKECKILKLSDGKEVSLGKRGKGGLFAETVGWEYPEMEEVLKQYLNSGFTVKNMTTGRQGESSYYCLFYLERDV